MKVACLQTSANDWKDANPAWAATKKALLSAADSHDLVVLPECVFPAYFLPDNERPKNVTPIDAVVEEVRQIAQQTETYIAFGYASDDENVACLFNRSGVEIGRKSKSYLWHFDRRWFQSGDEVCICETEYGKVALVICADARLPELVRGAAVEGAKLIIDLANLTAAGPDPHTLTNAQCEYMLGTRARENGVWLAVADKWGVEADSIAYAGRSAVYAPDGTCVAQAPSDADFVVSAEIPTDPATGDVSCDMVSEAIPNRRPELYSLLTTETKELPVYRTLTEAVIPELLTPYVTVTSLQTDETDLVSHLDRLLEHEPDLIVFPTIQTTSVDVASYQARLNNTQDYLVLSDFHQGVIRTRVVNRTGVLATYLTCHDVNTESPALANSDFPIVARTPFGVIGIVHGAELLLTETARCLMLAGADLIVWQHSMSFERALPLARTRAAENRIFVAGVYSAMKHSDGVTACSFIVDPSGNLITSTLANRPIHSAGIYCPLTNARMKNIVPGTHVVFDRKPQNYRRLVSYDAKV